jgi:uncharacterized protein YjbJ (UPF0337 family)
MSGTTDKVKGRVKQAVGVVTGNERLKDEGRMDQAAGKVKKAVERVIDKAKGDNALSGTCREHDVVIRGEGSGRFGQ